MKSITILPNRAPSPYEVLGRDPLGRAYFDDKDEKGGNAYLRYKIDPAEGAMVVLRPDGWIGTVVALRAGAAMELDQYFMDIFSDL